MYATVKLNGHSDDASAKTNLARYCIQISDRYRKMSKMNIETGKKSDPFCSCLVYDNLDQKPIGKNAAV